MTEPYEREYALRLVDGGGTAALSPEVVEAMTDGERTVAGGMISFDAKQKAIAEALIDKPNTNPERNTVMLDMNPEASNCPPRV